MKKQGMIIHPAELTDRMIDLLKHSRINVLGIHPVGGRNAANTLEELLTLSESLEFQNKLAQVRELGIAIEYELHALAWLLPRSMYEIHPEWFRMDKTGHRVNDFNLCVSNSDALEYLSSRAQELAGKLRSDQALSYTIPF